MRNQTYTTTTLSNGTNNICLTQAGTANTALTLNGSLVTSGVGTWPDAQKVTVTSAGNDTGITFAISGTDPDGRPITETLTGGNPTATTAAYFKTVTKIVPSGNTAANVTVGIRSTDGAVSKSLRVNGQQFNFKADTRVLLSAGASLTYTVQYTLDQPEDTYTTSYATNADWLSMDGLTALTASGISNVYYKVNSIRLQLTSGTYTSGTAKITVAQSI